LAHPCFFGRYGRIRIDCFWRPLVAESADVLVPEGDGDQPTTYQTICLGLEAIDSARDKREMLRATFLTIQALLEQGGFESSSARLPPSAHGLQRLLNRVEQCSERGLLCRKEVVNLMEGLKSSTEM
jgi:hypothetical protein